MWTFLPYNSKIYNNTGIYFTPFTAERGNMKKQNATPEKHSSTPVHHIPDIEILDLELDGNLTDGEKNSTDSYTENSSSDDYEEGWDEDYSDDGKASHSRKKLPAFVNMHVLFLLVVVIFFAAIFFKFSNWGKFVDLDEIFADGQGEYDDSLDEILPLLTGTENAPNDDGITTILAFGNGPFADDRNSEDNLANIIAKKADAVVYNCAVSGSYLAAQNPYFDADIAPMDAYTFYWLVTLASAGANSNYYDSAIKALGSAAPPEAQEVYDTLMNLDLNTVDVVVIMYDATDYLLGHEMYSDQNATDIQQFTGNLEAGLGILQENYPNIRIIVMSPTYAFAVDNDGNYVSSDIFTYGQDVLSTYVIKQYASASRNSVTFLDHLYGTITEDNADEYLTDNLHLNVEGRNLVADRFLYALNYYNHEK